MKVVSVQVGRPRDVEWRGESVSTAFNKHPVVGRVAVRRLNLDGDQQADLTVHGGREKAVYAYPSEHYAPWRQELPDAALDWGAFGENLTVEGLTEPHVRIGDRLRIGSAEFMVTQPRMPCYKLNVRFNRPDMVKRFLRSGRSGFYLSVQKEGDLSAGDSIAWTPADTNAVTVAEVVTLYAVNADNQDLLSRAVQTTGLPEEWREHFRTRLWDADT